MEDLIIVGASGLAKEVKWIAECNKTYNILGFLDDTLKTGETFEGLKILGSSEDFHKFSNAHFVIAIGNPRTRKFIFQKANSQKVSSFANIIHPLAVISDTTTIGIGNIIFPGAILSSETTIGHFNIINNNATIGHDSKTGDFVTIAPLAAISGNVSVEDTVEIGTTASIKQGLKLFEGSLLGMGAVLLKDLPKNEVYVGNPAKFLKKLT